MRRLTVLAVAALALLVAFGSLSQSDPGASAQDDIAARVGGLETRVAALEARIQAAPTVTSVRGSTVTVTADSITMTGSGQGVSEPFRLDKGNYVVRSAYQEAEGEYGDLKIETAPGSNGIIVYSDLFLDSGPFSGEKLVAVLVPGDFVLVADGNGSFTVVVELP